MKETLEKIAELKRQEKYIDGSISTWTKNDWQACYKEGFIEGAEYQAEQDQKTIDKLVSIIQWYDDNSDVRPDSETFMWFEQFKKK